MPQPWAVEQPAQLSVIPDQAWKDFRKSTSFEQFVDDYFYWFLIYFYWFLIHFYWFLIYFYWFLIFSGICPVKLPEVTGISAPLTFIDVRPCPRAWSMVSRTPPPRSTHWVRIQHCSFSPKICRSVCNLLKSPEKQNGEVHLLRESP